MDRNRSPGFREFVLVVTGLVISAGGLLAQPGPGSNLPPPVPIPATPGGVPVAPPPVSIPGFGSPTPSPAEVQRIMVDRAIVQFAQTPPRFHFTIDPKTPVKDLLPTPPPSAPPAGPALTDDLARVPEVGFQSRPAKIDPNELTKQTAHQLAKMNHLNATKSDGFMVALLENRPDLAGLPFAMGDDCRSSGERTRQFSAAVGLVRQALSDQMMIGGGVNSNAGLTPQPAVPPQASPVAVQPDSFGGLIVHTPGFWQKFSTFSDQADASRSKTDKALAEHVTVARIAALTQMLAAESPEMRLGLVKYLTAAPHVEATKALARMAIFSPEDDVRFAAVDALKVRRDKDYTEILLKGLQYPLPAVAKRSADAIARLDRSDLIPQLVAILDQPDPRLPTMRETGEKKRLVVREVVKMNHHRNCMMCHSPGNSGTVSAEAITAEVPIQGQALPTPSQGYRQTSPDLMIRVDVTYLRGDFSATLTVADAHPWPELQRFDFFIRERTVTADEAETFREKLIPKEIGVLSPYHRVALTALRDLTGKDTAPTAEAWRKLLGLTAVTAQGFR